MSNGPWGGASTGIRGVVSTGQIPYYSNSPHWPIFIKELEKRGLKQLAKLIK